MAEKLITEINQWDSMSPVSSMLPYKNWKEKRWEVKSLILFTKTGSQKQHIPCQNPNPIQSQNLLKLK